MTTEDLVMSSSCHLRRCICPLKELKKKILMTEILNIQKCLIADYRKKQTGL